MYELPDQFRRERKIVCIQGLGFVGAAMALAVADAKDGEGNPLYNVIGIDVGDEEGKRKATSINNGIFPYENSDRRLQKAQDDAYREGNLWATTDPAYFQYADAAVVDINLDITYTEDGKPGLDLGLFRDAIRELGKNLKAGALVLVETTVPPGTCEKVVYPILCEEFRRRGLPDTEVYLAHSYERVMPGENYFESIVNFWRVYAGINPFSADMCQKFLESIIHTDGYPLTRLEKTTATETAKVLENSYRAVNIAFMEEWGRFAEAVGIDLFEVIEAIRMRPTHSNMRQPGFGVGGYCLTKDPYFAMLAAERFFGLEDMDFPFSTQAVRVNNAMPLVSLDKIEELLGKSLQGKKLLVLGVSYRQDVGDTRYSPTETFVREALRRGADVVCQDPMVHNWKEIRREVLSELPELKGYDAIIFTVRHKQYRELDFKSLEISSGTLIFDANCVLSRGQREDISRLGHVRLACIGR